MFGWFKKQQPQPQPARRQARGFAGAKPSAMVKWQATYAKINAELKSDYIALTLRARSLAKNNEIVGSYIKLMIRNVLGANGFTFAETAYLEDGSPDRVANKVIENAWWDYTHSHRKYVSADHQMNEAEFDRHILFNLLVDGEVFIRRIDDKGKYGVRWEVLDALDVDTLYNADLSNGERICMGIKVDAHYRPLAYYVRKSRSTDYYLSGEREEIPASEIVHLYRKEYAGQVRGYTPLAAAIQCLAGLETYKQAEISASIINSAYMGIWQRTGTGDAYSQYSDDEIDENGDVATELETNVFRYAPEGYELKSIQSMHPNSNVGAFFKAMIKGIASALGISSNKLNSDYESVNYSSLRQANSEDINAWREIQRFLIDGWKDLQFAEWLKRLLLGGLVDLPYGRYERYLSHDFRGRSWEYLDPQKEYSAIKIKMELKLTNPIIELEKQGLDVDDVLDGWQLYYEKLKARGLPMIDPATVATTPPPVDADGNNEEDQQEDADD